MVFIPFEGNLRSMESDEDLLRRLRGGDEQAFTSLVTSYNGSMLRLARAFVPSSAVAEEVVQETWLAMLRGLAGFEGRSTLRTWLLSILINKARTAGVREQRSVPVADAGPAVDQSRFGVDGAWADPPERWVEEADDRIVAAKFVGRLGEAIDGLPPRQREIVLLRDVEGLSSEDVCSVLEISEANQRVLLHRGRSRLRQALEDEFREVR
jgi:RNA polymerase sigma-70 factor, ECF subfamily